MRTFRAVLLVIGFVLASSPEGQAQQFELFPVSADGAHVINGNEIVLDGAGQRIFLEFRGSMWDPDLDGSPQLKAWQLVLDSSGYSSGINGVLGPAVVPCASTSECTAAFGSGALCLDIPNQGVTCSPGFIDFGRSDYIFESVPAIPAVDLSLLNYRYGATVLVGPVTDDGTTKYVGTLVVDVPPGAMGTFTIGMIASSTEMRDENTQKIEPISVFPAKVTIKCQTNADCDDSNACTNDSCQGNGICVNALSFNPATQCCDPATGLIEPIDDGNECTEGMCNADGTVTQNPLAQGMICGNTAADTCDAQDTCDGGGSCVDRHAPGGSACGDQADSDCDHPDACDGSGTCSPILEPAGTACGNPDSSDCDSPDTCDGGGACIPNNFTNGIACTDDGNECLQDICSAGVCTHPPLASGTTCGDPTDTECDDPNTCDGAGACVENFEPSGLPCGNPVGNSCDNPDTCDGAGACQGNFVVEGVACGDPTNSDCDNPDTCDGSGGCDSNHEADGTVCTDDGNECRSDTCEAGACVHPLAPSGTPCGSPTETECDLADSCDGSGTCQTNLALAGAACGDPTITDCDRADACDGSGACVQNIEPAGTVCGDPSDTDCDDPDTCDGTGACVENVAPSGLPCGNFVGNQCDDPDTCDGAGTCDTHFVISGTPCGNPGSSECDAPDSCDGAGLCQNNNLEDGIACTDDGNECRADVCDAGACTHPLEPTGTPCGNSTETQCDFPDSCDGTGTCLPNLEPVGAPCGDPTLDACTDPDTCNGFGTCLVNNAPDGTDCDDGSFCNAGAICVAGFCGGGITVNCDDGLTCTDDSCNEGLQQCDNILQPGVCLIDGVCYTDATFNPDNDCQFCDATVSPTAWLSQPAGTECDDGDPCTGTGEPGTGIDTCDALAQCSGTVDPGCNDDCVNAVEVFDGTNIGNNAGRGPDDTEALCQENSNNDVWFFYVATCDGVVFVDTEGSAFVPFNDTVLSVYDACGGVEIACDDDSGTGLLSALTFNTISGATYYIRVAGFQDDAGDIALNIFTVDGCVIDDVCYEPGEANPTNTCEACIPFLNATGWSARPAGSVCGDPTETECDSPDSCNGLGVCETNPKSDFEPCGDDANDCTDDICFGGACTHPSLSVGTACGDPALTECDNPDTCDGDGGCQSNFVPTGLSCGDPSTSDCDNADICDGLGNCDSNHQPDGLICTDDGNDCSQDVCDSGACLHPPQPSGFACGDPTNTQCDNADTCDGAGVCLPEFEPSGVACGDPSDTDCDNPDTCNGLGTCRDNREAIGTACGDPTDTECDNSDTCDGAGGCLVNLEVDGFPCGDPNNTQCDNPDTCDGSGVCLDNFESLGLSCGDPVSSDCDNADICDGVGNCDPNHQPDGLACPDEGNQCTFDVCSVGVCDHPARLAGTPCGDPSNTQCDNPDTCDSGGVCRDNFEPVLFVCGDPADTECDNPDSCDGAGACLDNLEADGFTCGDATENQCNHQDTCDGEGTCLDNFEVNGLPCGDATNTQCDNPDTCDGSGACQNNFEATGLACGDPADTECGNPDFCDGLGVCDPQHDPDGTACTQDANDCSQDICLVGECAHPPEPIDTACGDPTDTQCDNPDSCDGAGACRDNFEPVGTACGDPSDSQCDHPDQCNDGGLCQVQFEPDGVLCDDGNLCTGDDACLAGLCTGARVSLAPLVDGVGSRYLRIQIQALDDALPQAIAVQADCPGATIRYVGVPQPFDVDFDGIADENVATLAGTTPDAGSFLTPAEWGELYVFDADIAADQRYLVWGDCGTLETPDLSEPGSATTCIFGDTVGDPTPDGKWAPCDGKVNITDITAVIEGFQGEPRAPVYQLDLAGTDDFGIVCAPDLAADLIPDAVLAVDAFQGTADPCPSSCP